MIQNFFSCLFTALLFSGSLLAQTPPKELEIELHPEQKYQTIHSFGASGCWFGEPIGANWPDQKKEHIAELLFSTENTENGSPKGLGLSAWRFNIGGGTAEQGDSSGIVEPNHRVESFLDENGNYDWSKQPGSQYLFKKATDYKVPNLIAFVNSPPVFFNKNGLGFLQTKGHTTNLKSEHYKDFAQFLATVVEHFDNEGYHFNYLSPINEPQWDWYGEFGNAKQEGTPYSNEEMFEVITEVNKALKKNKSETKIVMPEAAMLTYLTGGNGPSSNQINAFWDKKSKLYLGNLSHLAPHVAGHSYFTDGSNEQIISVREKVKESTIKYGLDYWQSEYSLLGNGYREGEESRSTLDCGLFLAKMIHHDLVVGNATAWHYWNSFEPGDWKKDTRYYLIAIEPNEDWTDGAYAVTGNFYALGHYSRFVRPGMQRIGLTRSDEATTMQAAEGVMISAYQDPKTNETVLVAINYTEDYYTLKIKGDGAEWYNQYITNRSNRFKYRGDVQNSYIQLMPRSIYTLVSD
ncbi:beta-glycosidase [Fulvivirga maritima]|uniref:glycoside hydrolase n=1 Tax=Fulvivirga maritima TaxID=2904247 RepID=UPI001F36CF97|nr:glycoside hydrolase [Fulvivirga maritima]UII25962.1 beta-glycosidase [Fulvivirga maritima]